MPRRYVWSIITYILMQLSGYAFGLVAIMIGAISTREELQIASGIWSIISFCSALIIMMLLLRQDMRKENLSPQRTSADASIMWAVLGIFMAFAAQYICNMIAFRLFGVDHASQNTEQIMNLAEKLPLFIIIVAIIGPILEEIIFRKILFGYFSRRFGFWLPAIISSLLFGAAHLDFTFLLTYAVMGMVFCFLYWKTQRILVPMVAHASMNAFVVLMQFALADQLQQYIKQMKQLQSFIG